MPLSIVASPQDHAASVQNKCLQCKAPNEHYKRNESNIKMSAFHENEVLAFLVYYEALHFVKYTINMDYLKVLILDHYDIIYFY